MKLGKLMIFVSDLTEARRFYGETLGFRLKHEDDRSLHFAHEGCDLGAFKCKRNATVQNYSDEARSVFVFEVPSIDIALQHLRDKGVEFLHAEPAENDFSRYAAFTDPFGNVHEIYELKN
jgi:glyoxylase I family protein